MNSLPEVEISDQNKYVTLFRNNFLPFCTVISKFLTSTSIVILANFDEDEGAENLLPSLQVRILVQIWYRHFILILYHIYRQSEILYFIPPPPSEILAHFSEDESWLKIYCPPSPS